MEDWAHILALVIIAFVIAVGLLLAVSAPFLAYRYFFAPERRASGIWRTWLRETAKVELVAAGIIAVGVAIGVLVFSPLDSPLRPVLLWVSLALCLMWAVAVPVLEYRRISALEYPGSGLVRSWLRGTVTREISTIYLIVSCLCFFLPGGSPLLRFLTSTPFILVFLTSSAIFIVIVCRNASRIRGAGT
jgi:hypothetical protein